MPKRAKRLQSVKGEALLKEPVWYQLKCPPIVGRSFRVGRNVLIDGHGQITIGDDVFCGHNVMILTGTHDPEQRGLARQRSFSARPVTLGDGVWICSGAIICPGVTVGPHSVVGPGAVVMRNVPSYTIVAGNPAQKVRRLRREGA
jgi:maltose O-acetyltransferase